MFCHDSWPHIYCCCMISDYTSKIRIIFWNITPITFAITVWKLQCSLRTLGRPLVRTWECHTVWSEGFLYKVAPPELKISPNVYFIMYNSVVLSKILKIVVPFWPCLSMSIIRHNNFWNFGLDYWIVHDKIHNWWNF